jgi:hypothetical protein
MIVTFYQRKVTKEKSRLGKRAKRQDFEGKLFSVLIFASFYQEKEVASAAMSRG